ncbi:hypothetical protein POX_f07411 [Penicillium oxalicum]|uniref:Uncharacterized protein n=1 Tax=Penicillium diatomitis TaxID=2819901 RepID=A0A9W9WQW6_9EURO|nr:hypothetical protein POX_f07411 [Penicillium oxalicum]XP_056786525.1 uncharacterized protein N7539_008548 [Penicillium diatomitis]KAI2787056.1 hypothetical protein POX_f07411 [Penicillium oxalicum]KAJ5471979.1 hypothetical protein N7539_008548 [Penicillium diatomitis]
MIGLKKRVRTDGGYADRFKEAFRPESLRTSIWSDQGSDPESAGEDEPHQLGFSPEPDAGNSSAAEETEDRQNSSGLPQGVLASATADELALVGMAEYDVPQFSMNQTYIADR